MKPDWDTLAEEYADHPGVLIGDVDCTAAGKPLCDAQGVSGFPTIKWGDPSKELQKYEGERKLEALKTFAADLKPLCSPANIDLCPEATRVKIEKLQGLPAAQLDADVAKWQAVKDEAESTFDATVKELEAQYEARAQQRDDILDAVLEAGLKTMKAVRSTKKQKKHLPKE